MTEAQALLCIGGMIASVTLVPMVFLIVLRGIFLTDLRNQKYPPKYKEN